MFGEPPSLVAINRPYRKADPRFHPNSHQSDDAGYSSAKTFSDDHSMTDLYASKAKMTLNDDRHHQKPSMP